MNIFQLQEVLKKTTKILAGDDVQVILEGFRPRVEYDTKTKLPTQVFIPAISGEVPHEVIRAIHGYIDHECSHIHFSDAEHICDDSKSELWHYIHNCIEDPRVNREMAKFYEGSAKNIKAGYDFLFTNFKGVPVEDHPYSKEHVDFLVSKLSDEKFTAEQQLRYSSLWFARKSNCPLSSEIYDKLEVHRLYDDLEKKMDRREVEALVTTRTTEDVVARSDYFEEFFSKEAMEKMNPKKGDGKGKPTGTYEKGNPLEKFEDKLARAIDDLIQKCVIESKENIYWTDRFDLFHDKKRIKNEIMGAGDNVKGFEEETRTVTNYLSKDLRRLLEERQRRYYIGGYKSGKLNTKRLYSVRLGNDRVFKKKNEIRELNAVCSLLVDMSGSMSGSGSDSKIKTAMQSAYAFAMVLEQLKIPFEIFGFTTQPQSPEMEKEYRKFILGLDRKIVDKIVNPGCPEVVYAFKEFNQPFDLLSKQCMVGAAKGATRKLNNEDSKHVRLALQRLSVRPEKVKSLFVFSDGQPAWPTATGSYKLAYDNLKYFSNNAKAKYGVDIYSIGIKNDSVKLFYKNWKLVKELKELPTALFDFLKKAI